MSTTIDKTNGFKQTIQNAGQKTKNFAKKTTDKVKGYGNKYKSDVRTAYDTGYAKGWDDAYDIPNRFLCKFVAGVGYRKGIKCRYKSDKYVKQYGRYSKKY